MQIPRLIPWLACCVFAAVALGETEVPSGGSYPSESNPDPTARAQNHEFGTKTFPASDTYNGYEPVVPDVWTGLDVIPEADFGVTIDTGTCPFYDQHGTRWADGKGVKIAGSDQRLRFDFSKRMGNRGDLNKIKNISVVLVYYLDGSDPNRVAGFSLTADSPSETSLPGSLESFTDGSWRMDAYHYTIDPQPDWEKFNFSIYPSAPAGGRATVYIDRIGIVTRCVPEPALLGIVFVGGVAAMRRAARQH